MKKYQDQTVHPSFFGKLWAWTKRRFDWTVNAVNFCRALWPSHDDFKDISEQKERNASNVVAVISLLITLAVVCALSAWNGIGVVGVLGLLVTALSLGKELSPVLQKLATNLEAVGRGFAAIILALCLPLIAVGNVVTAPVRLLTPSSLSTTMISVGTQTRSSRQQSRSTIDESYTDVSELLHRTSAVEDCVEMSEKRSEPDGEEANDLTSSFNLLQTLSATPVSQKHNEKPAPQDVVGLSQPPPQVKF